MKTTQQPPKESTECIALVLPASPINTTGKMIYAFYEYSKAFDERILRFGDGSWTELSPGAHKEIVLLPELDGKFIAELCEKGEMLSCDC